MRRETYRVVKSVKHWIPKRELYVLSISGATNSDGTENLNISPVVIYVENVVAMRTSLVHDWEKMIPDTPSRHDPKFGLTDRSLRRDGWTFTGQFLITGAVTPRKPEDSFDLDTTCNVNSYWCSDPDESSTGYILDPLSYTPETHAERLLLLPGAQDFPGIEYTISEKHPDYKTAKQLVIDTVVSLRRLALGSSHAGR